MKNTLEKQPKAVPFRGQITLSGVIIKWSSSIRMCADETGDWDSVGSDLITLSAPRPVSAEEMRYAMSRVDLLEKARKCESRLHCPYTDAQIIVTGLDDSGHLMVQTIEISPLISRLRFVGGIGDPSDPQNPTACVMSAAAANYRLSQGESIGDATDQLDCCCPVIRRLCIRRNDGWWPSDEARKVWALGLIARLPGTRGDMATTLRRGFRCADLAVRVLAPIALRAASREDLAAQLEAVSPIVDVESAKAARGVTQRASKSVAAFVAASYAASNAAYAASVAAASVAFADDVYAAEAYAASAAAYAANASTEKTWEIIKALIEEFVSETHPQIA